MSEIHVLFFKVGISSAGEYQSGDWVRIGLCRALCRAEEEKEEDGFHLQGWIRRFHRPRAPSPANTAAKKPAPQRKP